jgi:hypothetical protein
MAITLAKYKLGWMDGFWMVEMKSLARWPLFEPNVCTVEEGRGFSGKVRESNWNGVRDFVYEFDSNLSLPTTL